MKNKNRAIALLGIGLLFLASCATKYAPATGSFWDGHTGYSDIALDSTTWRVTFCGNNNTSPDVVDRYCLYRSAELTSQHGFDYFVVFDNNSAAPTKTYSHNTQQQTQIEHTVDPQTGKIVPVAVTTTNSSSTVTTQAPHTVTKTIRMFTGVRPADDPDAYDAKSMLTMMAPSIQR